MEKFYEICDGNGRILLAMANYELDPSYAVDQHTHHYLEISYIKEGSGNYYVDNKIYNVEKGDIFIFNNIEKHRIGVNPPNPLVNLVIHFEPSFIWSQTDNSFDLRYLQIFYERNESLSNRLDRDDSTTKKISQLFLEIEEEFINEQPGYELMVKVRLLNIFVLISRGFTYPQKDLSNIHNVRYKLASINKVLDYIDANIEQELSLEALANVVHMNPSYFSAFFKKYNGMNPTEYIRSKRIEKAIEYLKFSDKSLTEIASLCGFNNMTSFYNSFKKVTSSTPSDYR